MTRLLTRRIVVSKGENRTLKYGWWYLDAPFSFVVGTTSIHEPMPLRDLIIHIEEEFPGIIVDQRVNTVLETRPTITDDEDMRGFEEDKRYRRTLIRKLVRLEEESEARV